MDKILASVMVLKLCYQYDLENTKNLLSAICAFDRTSFKCVQFKISLRDLKMRESRVGLPTSYVFGNQLMRPLQESVSKIFHIVAEFKRFIWVHTFFLNYYFITMRPRRAELCKGLLTQKTKTV